MKKRTVIQCICDFCGKRGLSASSMTKHELHCTKNPNRVCRVCKMLDQEQPKMADLLATLPNPEDYKSYGEFRTGLEDGDCISRAMDNCLPDLRKAASNCPACIMAALRQKGIPIPCVGDFHFTNEMQAIWTEINNQRAEADEWALSNQE